MEASKTQYADSHGVSIAFQVIGDGPIDVVVVPGFISNVETMWSEPIFFRLLRNLTKFARVIVFDKRGTGCSDPAPGAPSLDERMDDIRAVMDAAGVEKAVIDGLSEGGPLAMLFAATYPERTQALILYGTFPKMEASGEPELPTLLDQLEGMLPTWGDGRSLEIFAPDLAHDPLQLRMWGVWERTGASPGMARSLITFVRRIDVRPVLSSISVPTLVIHRVGDRAVPIEGGRYLAAHIKGAQLLELPGDNHVVFEREIIDQICGAAEEFILGTRHGGDPERVLATVLFTDIVSSTEQAASMGDHRWRDVLQEHDDVVRRTIERYRGREVKTLGDGFLITFDSPGRAVECSLELEAELGSIGVSIRGGLHTGECEVTDDDVGGMAVNLASRIASLAAPNEVLVTGTVRDLVMGGRLRFAERGQHVLKGVPGEWPVYAAVGTGERADTALLPTRTEGAKLVDRIFDRVALRAHRLSRVGARMSRKVAATRR